MHMPLTFIIFALLAVEVWIFAPPPEVQRTISNAVSNSESGAKPELKLGEGLSISKSLKVDSHEILHPQTIE